MCDELLSLEIKDVERNEMVALCTFLKRVGWDDIRKVATSEDETYEMRNGILSMQEALTNHNFYSR